MIKCSIVWRISKFEVKKLLCKQNILPSVCVSIYLSYVMLSIASTHTAVLIIRISFVKLSGFYHIIFSSSSLLLNHVPRLLSFIWNGLFHKTELFERIYEHHLNASNKFTFLYAQWNVTSKLKMLLKNFILTKRTGFKINYIILYYLITQIWEHADQLPNKHNNDR